MKTLLVISIIFSQLTFGQTIKTFTLEFSMSDSRMPGGSNIIYWDTVQFYKGAQLINQIIPKDNHYMWPVEIKDFKSGIYRIVYKDLYSKKVSKLISLPISIDENELKLYWDELDDYPLNSLLALTDGEAIQITFLSIGCFNYDLDTLIITKQDSSYIAKLISRTKTKSVMLNQVSIDAFKRFENEIHALKDSYGCTTVDTYTITTKTGTLKRVDGGCAWRGFYYLKKIFFGKTE